VADAALLDPGLKKAQALLDWLRGRGAKATLREICNSGPSPLRKKAAADAPSKFLKITGVSLWRRADQQPSF